MTFVQNDVTKQFVKHAKSLIDKGIVKDYASLAFSLGWKKSMLSNVINNRRNVPFEVSKRFQEEFKINFVAEREGIFFTQIDARLLHLEHLMKIYEEIIRKLLYKKTIKK